MKSFRVCRVCGQNNKTSSHHLTPRASKKFKELRGSGVKTIHICHKCHSIAHRIWGPGDDYHGPEDPDRFIEELRIGIMLFVELEEKEARKKNMEMSTFSFEFSKLTREQLLGFESSLMRIWEKSDKMVG